MMIKSHLQGRDEKERWKEVMLEEHTECGCGCAYGSAEQCVDRFNPTSCECECDPGVWGAEMEACRARGEHYWDERFCVCRSNNKVRSPGYNEYIIGCNKTLRLHRTGSFEKQLVCL